MSELEKKYIENFNYSNLDDTTITSPADGDLARYDSSDSKWKNVNTSEVLLFTKQEYLEKVTVPDQMRLVLHNPCFQADLEIQGSGSLLIP